MWPVLAHLIFERVHAELGIEGRRPGPTRLRRSARERRHDGGRTHTDEEFLLSPSAHLQIGRAGLATARA